MTDTYDDIIDLPHHVSRRHRPMPIEERAAQFAAFDALKEGAKKSGGGLSDVADACVADAGGDAEMLCGAAGDGGVL